MEKYSLLIIALVLLCQVQCSSNNSSITSEEYEVYGQCLQSYCPPDSTNPLEKYVVIAGKTAMESDLEQTSMVRNLKQLATWAPGSLNTDWEALARSFLQTNQVSVRIDSIPVPCTTSFPVATSAQLKEMSINTQSASDYWSAFYQRYPAARGLITFSRIGFSPEHTVAFVTMSRSSGSLDAVGYDILLQKIESEWRIVAKFPARIS